jgi:hypothetical protein
METNPFLEMLKYKGTESKNQIENFTTELFVFIILYLINKKNKLVPKLLNKFGFPLDIDLDKFIIQTQWRTEVRISKDKKKPVTPDILMKYKNKHIIVEVKIDSKLNEDEDKFDNKILNQLDLYSQIKYNNYDIDAVYLLTKRIINIDNLSNEKIKRRIFWSEIHSLLIHSNDFTVGLFLKYLEVNGMAPEKLEKEILVALDPLSCLAHLIAETWDFKEYQVSKFEYSMKRRYFGAAIKRKGKNILWIGTGGGDDFLNERLYVHLYGVSNEEVAKKKIPLDLDTDDPGSGK